MPEIPEFIKKRMEDRIDHGTEEFVSRRVLRAGGVVGKQAVSRLRGFFFHKHEDPTMFDMARFLLTQRLCFLDVRVEAERCKTKKQAREAFLTAPQFEDSLILLARTGEHGAFAYFPMEGYAMVDTLRPPYTVLSKSKEEEHLFVEQDLESFCESVGVKNAVEDILHERLRI